MFIDTHAHICMVVKEKNIDIETIIAELLENRVDAVVDVCGTKEEFDFHEKVKETFKKNGVDFFAAAGIHPHESAKFIDSDISWIAKNSKNILAIGEVGLDLFYKISPEDIQEKMLRKMADLAIELNKPLLIHGRGGEEKIFKILEGYDFGAKKVLFHCYTGPLETAKKILSKGWFISFSGILTFKKSLEVIEIFKNTNLNKMFFETDSPFLAPTPFRGGVNTPAKVKYLYEFAANLLNMGGEDLAKQIRENFNSFFELSI